MHVKVYRFAQVAPENDETLSHGHATMAFIILDKLSAVPDSQMDVDPAHGAEPLRGADHADGTGRL